MSAPTAAPTVDMICGRPRVAKRLKHWK